MKKLKKTTKIVASIFLSVAFVCLISVSIILEPTFRISGFARLSADKLGALTSSAVFLDQNQHEIAQNDLAPTLAPARSVDFEKINQHTVDAFVCIEDKRFFSHDGVDYVRVLGAAVENFKHKSYREGGSTISQQLVKNTHLNSDKTLARKIQEIRIAKEVERSYSKDEILSMYLSCVYFGNGLYGIEAAARSYFDKDASEVSLDESAVLAGIINSPARFCPINNYEQCIKRRDLVLAQMHKNKKISTEQFEAAKQTKTTIKNSHVLTNQYILGAITEAQDVLNISATELFRKNYRVFTHFDAKISDIIARAYEETEFFAKNETDFCAIVVDNASASVRGFFGTGRRNYLAFKRSPASTIKPLIAYAPAIEKGLVSPISPILDQKMSFGDYSPSNYQDKYQGWISVEDSLASSSNVAAIKLFDASGIDYAKQIGGKMGISFGATDQNLALALGGMENGVTLQQLAAAYRVLSSGGIFEPCAYISKIEDQNGNTIYTDNRPKRRAISQETAYLVSSMLAKCADFGTAKQLKGLNVYAKTGTAGTKEGNTDAYCISFDKDFTVAVWLGAKNKTMPNSVSGGTQATKLNKIIMQNLLIAKTQTATQANPNNTQTSKNNTQTSKNNTLKSYQDPLNQKITPKGNPLSVPDGIIELEIDSELLKKQQKIALANDQTPKKARQTALFDKRNQPKQTSTEYFNRFLLYKDCNAFNGARCEGGVGVDSL